jgi:hypothetical protein
LPSASAFGFGFMVTDRMLGMFSKKPKPKAEADGKGGGP